MTARTTSSRLRDTFSAPREPGQQRLAGKSRILPGVANEQSITWACARAFRGIDADLCITDRNERSRKFTEPLAQTPDVRSALHLPCDVHLRAHPGQ